MSRSCLRWARVAVVGLSLAALFLSRGPIGSTLALFNGETQNAGSTFAGGWIGAPTSPTATVSGYDVALAWTPGTHGPVTGQQLFGVDNTTNSNCTGAAYASLATMASASTATYTDSNRGSTINGNWFCYELVSTSATVWTAATTLPALQVGLVATALTIANAGTSGVIDKNDTITITFNQKTTLAGANIKVCAWTTGVVVIGDTQSGCSAASDPYSVAKLTGVTIGACSSPATFNNSALTVSSAAPWTATIKLASNSTCTETGTAVLTTSASVKSFATTDQATACTAATTNCQPASATHF